MTPIMSQPNLVDDIRDTLWFASLTISDNRLDRYQSQLMWEIPYDGCIDRLGDAQAFFSHIDEEDGWSYTEFGVLYNPIVIEGAHNLSLIARDIESAFNDNDMVVSATIDNVTIIDNATNMFSYTHRARLRLCFAELVPQTTTLYVT